MTALLYGPRLPACSYLGVKRDKRTRRWEAKIWDCGRQTWLGAFGSSHEAARAYDKARLWLHYHSVLVHLLTACS
jgi:hypothetical protein